MTSCELNQIFLGEVASIQNYGAFVRIPGCKQQGLIHKSQVSNSRVDDVADILQRGDRVWCKVINVGDDGKVGLSMKHVNQGNGKDLDPNGVEQQLDEQRRKKMIPGQQKKPIELQAVLNTTCAKCGTRGHLKKDCFMAPDGQKYDLVPEMDEATEPEPPVAPDDVAKAEKRSKSKKLKKRKKSKKSRQRSDGSSDEEDDDEDDSEERERKRKRGRKKRSKESRKKRKRKHSESSSDSDSSESPASRDTKKRRESGDKKSKKCKHSRSKHSD